MAISSPSSHPSGASPAPLSILKSAPPAPVSISPVSDIVDEIRKGNIVILVDDEDRENEGDLVFASEYVTPEKINFLAKYARGLICLTVTQERGALLGLKPMAQANGTKHGTNFTVSIEAAEGVTTGISAADRSRTVEVAVAKNAKASDIVQPGHIFPIVAQPGGVLVRAGHTEAGCDLAHMAGLMPSSVICEVMNDDGTMARMPDLLLFAAKHGLKIGTIADLIHYRSQTESLIERVASRTIHTTHGPFEAVAYVDQSSKASHLALVRGDVRAQAETLVRVHEPLSVMDLLDVGTGTHSWSVDAALKHIAQNTHGVAVLLNCPENAAQLFAKFDDLNAGRKPMVKMDLRTYGIGAQILRDVGVKRMKLMSNPRKMPSMAGFGLEVTGYLEAAPKA
jgi:3,4-dihydroxy 2-butanone 4-phosphate synthase / GTP cyclohydrolase II